MSNRSTLTAADSCQDYILILSPGKSWGPTFSSDGRIKKTWIIRLPKGVEGYPWGRGGEEGDESGRSVKSEPLIPFRRHSLPLPQPHSTPPPPPPPPVSCHGYGRKGLTIGSREDAQRGLHWYQGGSSYLENRD